MTYPEQVRAAVENPDFDNEQRIFALVTLHNLAVSEAVREARIEEVQSIIGSLNQDITFNYTDEAALQEDAKAGLIVKAALLTAATIVKKQWGDGLNARYAALRSTPTQEAK